MTCIDTTGDERLHELFAHKKPFQKGVIFTKSSTTAELCALDIFWCQGLVYTKKKIAK